MAEKLYSAKEAALAVLKKTQEILVKSSVVKNEELSKAEPKGEIHPKEQEQAPKDGIEPIQTPAPEAKENGNPEWGSDPKVYGHIKLAKFIGHMESKRKAKAVI